MLAFRRRGWLWLLAALVLGACVHAQTLGPHPALWMVEVADSRIYLFGTIHVLRPEDVWRDARVESAFRESHELVLEVAEADDAAAIGQLVRQLGVDREIDLRDRLAPQCRADFDAAIGAYGANPQGMARLKPWLAALSFSQLAFSRSGYDAQLGVDFALKHDAAEAGMSISSLETAEGQMRRLAGLSDSTQVAHLCDTLAQAPTLAAQLDEVRQAWLRGDIAMIAELLQGELSRSHPELYRTFFVERNQAMAQAIAARLDGAGTIFIAIGAGHLAGDDSVLAELGRHGLRVRRIR